MKPSTDVMWLDLDVKDATFVEDVNEVFWRAVLLQDLEIEREKKSSIGSGMLI